MGRINASQLHHRSEVFPFPWGNAVELNAKEVALRMLDHHRRRRRTKPGLMTDWAAYLALDSVNPPKPVNGRQGTRPTPGAHP